MVQGLEGPLVTPSRRLCEILGASPQLDHIGLVPGVFICEPLAYLDCRAREVDDDDDHGEEGVDECDIAAGGADCVGP
jgi:hypothetical protein